MGDTCGVFETVPSFSAGLHKERTVKIMQCELKEVHELTWSWVEQVLLQALHGTPTQLLYLRIDLE
jgi:hypothetical protein